jgi:acyl carrier protein
MLNCPFVYNPNGLQAAFRQGLALPPAFDVTHADNSSLGQWDSVAHLQLVVAIEDEFGIRLTPADVIELKSYPAAIAILRRHGVWSDA